MSAKIVTRWASKRRRKSDGSPESPTSDKPNPFINHGLSPQMDSLANEMLLSGGFLRPIEEGGDQRRRLLDLCHSGDWHLVRYYIDYNERQMREAISIPLDDAGNTPLHIAVSMFDHSLVCLLLLKGADANVPNRADITPTILACRLGHTKILTTLRKHGGIASVMERKMAQSRATNNVIALAAGPADSSTPNTSTKTGSTSSSANGSTTARRTSNPKSNSTPNSTPPISTTTLSRPAQPPVKTPGTAVASIPTANPSSSSPPVFHHSDYINELRILVRSFPRNYFTPENAAWLGGEFPVFDAPTLAAVLNFKDSNGWTPLMKASYKGHLELVRSLITRGADVKEFDKLGCTALVWACLGCHEDVVDALINEGDAAVNAYLESAKFKVHPPPTPLVAACFAGSLNIVRQLVEAGAKIDTRVGPGRGKSALMVACWMKRMDIIKYLVAHQAAAECPSKNTEEWIRRGMAIVKNISQRGTFTAASGPSLKGAPQLPKNLPALSQDEVDLTKKIADALDHANEGTPRIASPQSLTLPIVAGVNVVKRRRAKNDPGLELFIAYNPDVLSDLLDRLPDRGTELDFQFFLVIQCVVELVLAASRNQKAEYVTITAKINHLASEIVRAIESFDSTVALANCNSTGSNAPRLSTAVKPTSPTAGTPNKTTFSDLTTISFGSSPLRSRLRLLSAALNGDLPRALLVATKVACGVWPPAEAVQDMSMAAGNIARVCRELVDVANTTGFWPLLEKELVLRVVSDHLPKSSGGNKSYDTSTSDVVGGVPLTYDQYKRVNDIRELEEQSKQYELATQEMPAESVTKKPGEKFLHDLEFVLLRQFVAAFGELKKLHELHLKQEYMAVTSLINARADTIVEEIRNFELISDLQDSIMLEPEDMQWLQETGVATLLGITALPTPIQPFIVQLMNDVKITAMTIMLRGNLAAGIWPTPTASQEMLAAAIPCVLAVRALVNLTKVSISKSIQQMDEERKKKEEWNRTWQQNERTKKMFKILDSQEAGPHTDLEDLTDDETTLLADNLEGLLIEGYQVRGGRLPKLLEQITTHRKTAIQIKDPELMAALLMTHHSFTTSIELLDALIKRYDIGPPYGLNKQNFDIYIHKKVVPIRFRVYNVLRFWIESYPEDFIENEVLVRRMNNWIEKRLKVDFDSLAMALLRALNLKLTAASQGNLDHATSPISTNTVTTSSLGPSSASFNGPKPILPRNVTGNDLGLALLADPKFFFDIDPLEIARQLVLMTYSDFKNVRPVECLDQIWGDKRRKELAKLRRPGSTIPAATKQTFGGIGKLIQHTNRLSMWVAHHVLNCDSIKSRVAALKYFCQLALHCRELKDFNGITGIVAGLSMAPVLRLKRTWQAFEDKHLKIREAFTELADLVSPKGQYTNYRKVLATLSPPAIPFLGVCLTDMTFIELGNPDYLPESSFINFDKRRKIFQVMKDIQKFQSTPFELAAVPGIQKWLEAVGAGGSGLDTVGVARLSNEDELYQISLAVEPREDAGNGDDDDDM
ncbi:hypothetical protein SeMB42_g04911 [Synchytrium endobioticum]|uniref:Ras-GEF domain-containing protein n=1 Tax=Synchytrium endobioticum TaxID=286115 RepID=A0A507CUX7_9FUNG|nr:hypothetical protein SeLEV6574_g07769 [Synchytrium endobioticum]TPX42973.1 hypothetical protein SeMB42_g04911 [Synchytrium endobioticum]